MRAADSRCWNAWSPGSSWRRPPCSASRRSPQPPPPAAPRAPANRRARSVQPHGAACRATLGRTDHRGRQGRDPRRGSRSGRCPGPSSTSASTTRRPSRRRSGSRCRSPTTAPAASPSGRRGWSPGAIGPRRSRSHEAIAGDCPDCAARKTRLGDGAVRRENGTVPLAPRGITLIELLAVLAVSSVLLAIAIGLIQTLLRASGAARSDLEQQNSVARLADAFRRDVHAATAFHAGPAKDGNPVEWTFDLGVGPRGDVSRRVRLSGADGSRRRDARRARSRSRCPARPRCPSR